jgi:hypothetical protein
MASKNQPEPNRTGLSIRPQQAIPLLAAHIEVGGRSGTAAQQMKPRATLGLLQAVV